MASTPIIAAAVRQLRQVSSTFPLRITLKQERARLMLALADMGELAGEGAFGATFLCQSHAIKLVLTKESQGYLAYARFCRSNHKTNRLLPRVDAVCEVGRYTMVWMEKLHESPELSKDMCRPLKRVSRNHQPVNEASRLIGRSAGSLNQAMERLKEILSARRESYWDIRVENILFRRERGQMKMVLTDPIAY